MKLEKSNISKNYLKFILFILFRKTVATESYIMPVQTRQQLNPVKDEKQITTTISKALTRKTECEASDVVEPSAKKSKMSIKSEKSENTKLKSEIFTLEDSKTHNKLNSFWLMKSEPETRMQNGQDMKFGIEDLKLMKEQTEHWDGVCDCFYYFCNV